MSRVSVLVVGGGPIGLSLATDLGWRGIRCLLVERRDGAINLPKMNMVSARTMEFCRRWGIAREVRRLSIPEDFPRTMMFGTAGGGYLLARFDYPSWADAVLVHSPEYLQRCSQIHFDPLLRRTAASFPSVVLRHETELVELSQDRDGVTATLRDLRSSGTEVVRADYVVGCDGADSFVRQSLDIAMLGDDALSRDINIFFESDDFPALCPHGRAVMQMIVGPEGHLATIVAVDGIRQWRISTRQSNAPGSDLSAWAADFVRRIVGLDFAFEMKSVLPWTRRRVVAERYGVGRVFLAGDAVHQLSPTGGFGMNTGIGDAIDLSWKLAATLEGWGGTQLLDSYEAERLPIGAFATEEGARNFGALRRMPSGAWIAEESPRGETLRYDVSDFIRKHGYEREFETEGVVFGYRYENSPIIWPDGTPEPVQEVMSYHPTARPGHRAPHVWTGPDRSVLDLFGRGFTLLDFGADPADVAAFATAARDQRVPCHAAPLDGAEGHALYERRLVLVRPDGHVAWRGDGLDRDPADLLARARGAQPAEVSP